MLRVGGSSAYATLDFVEVEVPLSLHLDGSSVADHWNLRRLHSLDPELPLGDAIRLLGCPGFLCERDIADRLARCQSSDFELFPLGTFRERELWFFNVTRSVSAFDERLMDGMSWRRLHFREGLLPASGFFREESVPYVNGQVDVLAGGQPVSSLVAIESLRVHASCRVVRWVSR
jgi:hypothetical protein